VEILIEYLPNISQPTSADIAMAQRFRERGKFFNDVIAALGGNNARALTVPDGR
jgi:hypothetical protein